MPSGQPPDRGPRSRRCPLQPHAQGLGDLVGAGDGQAAEVGEGPGHPKDYGLARG